MPTHSSPLKNFKRYETRKRAVWVGYRIAVVWFCTTSTFPRSLLTLTSSKTTKRIAAADKGKHRNLRITNNVHGGNGGASKRHAFHSRHTHRFPLDISLTFENNLGRKGFARGVQRVSVGHDKYRTIT